MADKKQELGQIKEWEPIKIENKTQKINLGWKGYVPGYKRRWTNRTNKQIRERFGALAQRIEQQKLPSKSIERPAEAEEQEIEYSNQLAFEREQEAQTTDALTEEGKSFGRPSFIKYFVLFFVLAIPNDAIDAIELTGFFAILAWFVSFFLSISSILIMWFTDQEQKRAQGYMKKVEEFQKTAARTVRTTLMVAKFFRNTKFAGRVTKNPLFKIVAGAVAEMVPFLSIFPWSSISVILAYLDERKTYKNAGETSEKIGSTMTTETA